MYFYWVYVYAIYELLGQDLFSGNIPLYNCKLLSLENKIWLINTEE